MSVHPSLSSKDKSKRTRSVLKRFERLKELLEKEKWKAGNSIFGLPKVKTMRRKLKKAKKAAETGEVQAEQVQQAAPAETPAKKEKKTSDKK